MTAKFDKVLSGFFSEVKTVCGSEGFTNPSSTIRPEVNSDKIKFVEKIRQKVEESTLFSKRLTAFTPSS